MTEFIISLLSVSVVSATVSALFPESELKKPLEFMCRAVTSVSVFAVISSVTFSIPLIPKIGEYDFTDVFAETVEESVKSVISPIVNEDFFVKYEDGIIISDLSDETVKKINLYSIPEKGE